MVLLWYSSCLPPAGSASFPPSPLDWFAGSLAFPFCSNRRCRRFCRRRCRPASLPRVRSLEIEDSSSDASALTGVIPRSCLSPPSLEAAGCPSRLPRARSSAPPSQTLGRERKHSSLSSSVPHTGRAEAHRACFCRPTDTRSAGAAAPGGEASSSAPRTSRGSAAKRFRSMHPDRHGYG